MKTLPCTLASNASQTITVPFLMTRQELAAALRVDPRTIERWEAKGAVPVKIARGPFRRYVLEDVLAALEGPPPESERKTGGPRVTVSDLVEQMRADRKRGRR